MRLLRSLVVAPPDGIAADSLAEQSEVSPSNVSFHLKELVRAGTVSAWREGRSIVYARLFSSASGSSNVPCRGWLASTSPPPTERRSR
ncbi:hypothetical protein MPL3356_340119 [Mesorhizobium plurifarium]|uniref:Uncharacterized protein n=1 Tax=Mesorhizobium plurifarium TaxID=69974 RepID=A0A090E1M2_MESPL|nr:hypothetical protein MPL3356_340119 [Mesorhizobium plurifarium]